MSRAVITPACRPLRGSPRLPGDKSISHRRALMSLFTNGEVVLDNYASGWDCASTLACVERLGKRVRRDGNRVVLSGAITRASVELDCGNSGTTARLLMGILAGRRGEWILRGDTSLSRRPMERVAEPLRTMGASIETSNGHLPVRILGRPLRAVRYDASIASAQVKSAVLLAGLSAEGITRYREPSPSRDHTERILNLSKDARGWITLDPSQMHLDTSALSASIPGDPSAAAFWIVAALLIPGSSLDMNDVLANPIRTLYLRLLKQAGARVEPSAEEMISGEPVAAITAESSAMRALQVDEDTAPSLIDEIPLLAVLAVFAEGVSEFRGIGELRVKESDRLALLAEGLTRMGARVDIQGDSLSVIGGITLHGAEIETRGDHRMAMSFAIAGLAAEGKTVIRDAECAAVSYPEFWDELNRLSPGSVTLES